MDIHAIFNQMKNRTPTILGIENFSKYAVLLPLIQKSDDLHVLFEVRSLKLRRQPGEICFPGGRMDSVDTDQKTTAIRETTEELGISSEDISNVFPLDYLISPNGMILYAFAGFILHPEKMKPNPSEVGEIFTVPLTFFLENKPKRFQINLRAEPEENSPYNLVIGGQKDNWQTNHVNEKYYEYQNRVIWGLTARILAHFIDILHSNK